MGFLVLSFTIAVFLLIVAIFSGKGLTDDQINKRIQIISGKSKKEESVEELNDTFVNRVFGSSVKKLREGINKINSRETNSNRNSERMQKTERQIRQAGMDLSLDAFLFYKQAFMIGMIIVILFVCVVIPIDFKMKALIFAIGCVLAIVLPDFYLKAKAGARQEAIRIQVPDALDLLGVCIEAGLSFDSSLAKVADKLEGPFIDELMVVYREIQMGVPRNDALRRLSDATDIAELKTFISALIQANQLGIPINNVMAVQSKQLRETRQQQAKEKGAKAPVKILFPMLLLIFPVLFIILMAPTVINIMDTLM